MVAPGARHAIRTGAHPFNTGGKKGRSGAKRDRVRRALLDMGTDKALPFLSSLLDGRVPVTFVGTCPSCRAHQPLPEGDEFDQLADAVADRSLATVEARIKASEQAWKYGLGVQKEVSVDNVRARVTETLSIIVATCSPEQAQALITAIEPVWK